MEEKDRKEEVLRLIDSMFQIHGRPLTASAVQDFAMCATPRCGTPEMMVKGIETWMAKESKLPSPSELRYFVYDMVLQHKRTQEKQQEQLATTNEAPTATS